MVSQWTSSPEFICWTTVREIDWAVMISHNHLLPRYTQFGGFKAYVGLREKPEDAWSSRVSRSQYDAIPADFLMVKVTLSSRGFMQFATEIYLPGTPRLHKAIYGDGREWGARHFYGGIPLSEADPVTGESLVSMETVDDWDYDN